MFIFLYMTWIVICLHWKSWKNCMLSRWSMSCFPYLAYVVQVYTWLYNPHAQQWFATVDLVRYCSLLKTMYFWIQSNPAIDKRKVHKPSLYSDVVWLSLCAQCKFHMDLSFPSIKISGMKFLPQNGRHGCLNSRF